MKKSLVLLVVLVLAALFVFGCARGGGNYPTGYTPYGQQQAPQQQAYVGGGCAVDGPEPTDLVDVSEPSLAA